VGNSEVPQHGFSNDLLCGPSFETRREGAPQDEVSFYFDAHGEVPRHTGRRGKAAVEMLPFSTSELTDLD